MVVVREISSNSETEPRFSSKTIAAIIEKIHELKGFAQPQLARLSKLEVTRWGPSEILISEGSEGSDQMIIILAGKVYVRKKVKNYGHELYEQMAEISGPAIVGENSFFTGLSRSAAVYAKEKVAGIVVRREEFNRLVNLDKGSFVKFLRQMAEENLERAERTLVLYMNTLQIVLNTASMSKSNYFQTLDTHRRNMDAKSGDIAYWQEIVRNIMLFIRELNNSLEELYEFANLPEITMVAVDIKKFTLPKNNKFYDIFKEFAQDMNRIQQLVPLATVDFKNSLMTTVLTIHDQGVQIIDYPKIISVAGDAYMEFTKSHAQMGFGAKITIPAKTDTIDEKRRAILNLLWEDI